MAFEVKYLKCNSNSSFRKYSRIIRYLPREAVSVLEFISLEANTKAGVYILTQSTYISS
jgi:hypothetical protein